MDTPAARATKKIVGDDSYTLFIEAPTAKAFVLDIAIPVGYKVISLTSKLASGTCTINAQRIVAGVAGSIAGLSAIAASSTKLTSAPTNDGTEAITEGDGLQVTLSAISSPVDLSISIRVARQ